MDNSPAQHTPTRSAYVTGLVLAVILTAVPFALVAFKLLSPVPALLAIAVAAVIQVGVHLRYFLHIDLTHTPRENLLALSFAALLIVIMVGGSLWIMFDLHHRMM